MRTLRQIRELYEPKSPDEKKFVAKHKVEKTPDANKNGDDVFKASNIKGVSRQPEHGYDPGKDEKVYEEVEKEEIDLKEYEQHVYYDSSGRKRVRDDDGNDEPYYGKRSRGTYFGTRSGNREPDADDSSGTPHAVHINGRKWKEFGTKRHAENVARKLGSKATVHPVKEDVEQADEGYVSHAQRKAVWANRADGGRGHPDKKKKMKEEVEEIDEAAKAAKNPDHIKRVEGSYVRGEVIVTTNAGAKHTVSAKDTGGKMPSPGEHIGKYVKESNLDEGDVVQFPKRNKKHDEEDRKKPGWILRQDPKLAAKFKEIQDRKKREQEFRKKEAEQYEEFTQDVNEVAPPGSKFERMVKHIKKSYSKDGLTPKEKSIAYATAWKQYNKEG